MLSYNCILGDNNYYTFALLSGEFGIVYKAQLSKGFNKPYSEVVAVKTLKGVLCIITCRIATGGWPHFRLTFSGFVEKALIKDLLKECTKMSTLDHPNVLTLMGVCLDGGPAPFIVMPFMFNGSLISYLKKESL